MAYQSVFQSFIQGQQAREQSDANQLALQQARQKVQDQNTLRQLARDSVQREAFTDYPTMDGEKLPGLYTGKQTFDTDGYKNRLYGAGMVDQALAVEKSQAEAQKAGWETLKLQGGIVKDQAQTGLYGVQKQKAEADIQAAQQTARLKATREALLYAKGGNVDAGIAHFNASVPEGERITGYQPVGKGLVLKFENGTQMQIPDVDGMIQLYDGILTNPNIYTAQSNQETRRHNQSMENLGVAKLEEIDRYHQGMLGLYGAGGRPPAGYRPTPDGGLTPIPGGPADQASKFRPLPGKAIDDIAEAAGSYQDFERLVNTFRPNYGGYTVTGEASNFAQRLLGDAALGVPQGQAQWWQDYQNKKNVIRNQLFGAALTQTEKAAFDKAQINPSMDPSQIRANLQRQYQAAQRAATKIARAYAAGGYSVDQIREAMGGAAGVVDWGSVARPGQPKSSAKPQAAAPTATRQQPAKVKAVTVQGGKVPARLAPDGHYYIQRNGQYFRVD